MTGFVNGAASQHTPSSSSCFRSSSAKLERRIAQVPARPPPPKKKRWRIGYQISQKQTQLSDSTSRFFFYRSIPETTECHHEYSSNPGWVPVPHLARRAPSFLLLPPCNTNLVIAHSAVPASAALGEIINRLAEGQESQKKKKKKSGRQIRCRGSLHSQRRIPPRPFFVIIWDNVKETVTGGHPAPTDPV